MRFRLFFITYLFSLSVYVSFGSLSCVCAQTGERPGGDDCAGLCGFGGPSGVSESVSTRRGLEGAETSSGAFSPCCALYISRRKAQGGTPSTSPEAAATTTATAATAATASESAGKAAPATGV